MKRLVLSPFNIWLSAAIELIPRDELMALIRQFNSEAEYPTVKLLNTLITEYGHEFARPLGELAIEYSQTDESMDKMLSAARKLKQFSGKTDSTADAAQQSSNALSWFKEISVLVSTTVGGIGDITRAVNGTDKSAYDAKTAAEQAKMEQERTTRAIVGWGVGLVIAIILFFVMYKMFYNK